MYALLWDELWGVMVVFPVLHLGVGVQRCDGVVCYVLNRCLYHLDQRLRRGRSRLVVALCDGLR